MTRKIAIEIEIALKQHLRTNILQTDEIVRINKESIVLKNGFKCRLYDCEKENLRGTSEKELSHVYHIPK